MMDAAWIKQLFVIHNGRNMGHAQRATDQNLGLGWLYYALVRLYKPTLAVVIGSWRGFAPMIIAKAMSENREGGKVVFIDPSLVDDFWADPLRVRMYFELFDVADYIEHFKMTTQEYVASAHYKTLPCDVGFLFIDGYHTAEQAKYDHEAFCPKLKSTGAPVLFHDSQPAISSAIYGQDKAYEHGVDAYLRELREQNRHVTNFPFGRGVALVLP